MELLHSYQLRRVMPRLSAEASNRYVGPLRAALAEFDIDTPARVVAFLAQIAHESGELRHWKEMWGPTDAQKRYEPPHRKATELGNVKPGDGFLFRARGPIGLTGRANYRRFGRALGIDLESEPDRAADPDVGFRVAGLFWQQHRLNDLADLETWDAFRRMTVKINGGVNGLADREKYYALARMVFGLPLLQPKESTS
jgi:putative chitinase